MWLSACAPSHYLNESFLVVNWTMESLHIKFSENLIKIENIYDNKMHLLATKYRPFWLRDNELKDMLLVILHYITEQALHVTTSDKYILLKCSNPENADNTDRDKVGTARYLNNFWYQQSSMHLTHMNVWPTLYQDTRRHYLHVPYTDMIRLLRLFSFTSFF